MFRIEMRYLRIGGLGIMMRVGILLALMLLISIPNAFAQPDYNDEKLCEIVDTLQFNGTSANSSVQAQVDLGPRLPGSNASSELRQRFSSQIGSEWVVTEDPHSRGGLNITNLIATWSPSNSASDDIVILAAHYDSRDRAERDPDENKTSQPIPGANDGASGVAVLEELGRIIPTIGLRHEVRILLTDAEDQGVTPSMLGAKAWAENISREDRENISAFILLDMVGDANLTLTKTWPGSETLWNSITPLAAALGMMDTELDCSNSLGDGTFNPAIYDGVIDDHVPVHNLGIRAIDIIDLRYGDGAEPFEGHWHTHEDTPDKVSSESLEKVGRLVELGLRNGSWVDILEDDTKEDVEIIGNPIAFTIACLTFITLVFVHLKSAVNREVH